MDDDELKRLLAMAPADLLARIRGTSDYEKKFWCGMDKDALEAEFKNPTEAAFRSIRPIWNYDPAELEKTEITDAARSGLRLYSAKRDAFLRHHMEADLYTIEAFRDRSSHAKLLRVVGHWKRGDALCPPVLTLFEPENKLLKLDGHHRTTIAVLTGATHIPFYSKSLIALDGIEAK